MPSARMSPWDSPKSGLSFEDASRAMMYGSSPCRTCTAQTNHDHCTAPPSAPKASTQQCPHSTRHTCSIGCDQNPVQQTPPTTVRHAPGQRNRSRPARAGRRSACPAGTCTHQLRSRTATRAMFSGKSKIRILIQRGQKAIKWPFDPSGFRRGTKCSMGAPSGDDFLFAPLGAGRYSPSGLLGWMRWWRRSNPTGSNSSWLRTASWRSPRCGRGIGSSWAGPSTPVVRQSVILPRLISQYCWKLLWNQREIGAKSP